ncbi:MAG: hypothetical protein LUE27_01160 [Clostridia bacterium]|nr:hypothetical protein [Clostridia bacterium]
MTPVSQKKVEYIMNHLFAEGYFRGLDWNGCEVYRPIYSHDMYLGSPWVVFVYGDDARLSTRDEAMEYSDFIAK